MPNLFDSWNEEEEEEEKLWQRLNNKKQKEQQAKPATQQQQQPVPEARSEGDLRTVYHQEQQQQRYLGADNWAFGTAPLPRLPSRPRQTGGSNALGRTRSHDIQPSGSVKRFHHQRHAHVTTLARTQSHEPLPSAGVPATQLDWTSSQLNPYFQSSVSLERRPDEDRRGYREAYERAFRRDKEGGVIPEEVEEELCDRHKKRLGCRL